ncbi:hypothetical protein INR49_002345 [Caranx melampygus]|nr:hypothetical protein INR49_002345 [Caranx melampygus]
MRSDGAEPSESLAVGRAEPSWTVSYGAELQCYRHLPAGGRRMSRKLGLSANSSQFTLEGEPFQIIGGSIHYFRVPRAYWRDRLLKMKACGINTSPRSAMESAPTKERSFQLPHTAGFRLALRDGSMRLRTTYSGFTQAVNTFLTNLYQNWFHSRSLKLQKLNQRDIQDLNALQPNGPVMVMDYWTGWYDVWGDLHHVLPPEDAVSTMREMLRRGFSVNLYMFHGGSSFGFMSGALADPSYKALVPSYDYDAPLTEAGEYTPKYHLLRDLLSRYNRGRTFPDMPALHYRESYEPAIMYQHLSLWDALSFAEGPFKSPKPVNMENLPVNNGNGQSYGYTLYETTITSLCGQKLHWLFKRQSLELAVPDGQAYLSLLVENVDEFTREGTLINNIKALWRHFIKQYPPAEFYNIQPGYEAQLY